MADELIFVDLSHSKKIGDFKLATSLLEISLKANIFAFNNWRWSKIFR